MPLLRAYLQPAPLFAVALLVVNDHLLKGSGLLPDLLTGKLSDLAGLFFFPLLTAALLELTTPARRHPRALLAGCCLITALAFSAVQLVPDAAAALHALSAALGPATVTPDPTDLLALPATLLAWRHGTRVLRGSTPPEADLSGGLQRA